MSGIKDYLTTENARNHRNAELYAELIKRAYGKDQDVLIGHHLNFETHGDLNTINEIPSADTLIFDHDIMRRVFPQSYVSVMLNCALMPAEYRDIIVSQALKDGLL